tara:strand:+ start:351 stop:677 length:327 start_codon:yes stop_codon:yes gene_type:complete
MSSDIQYGKLNKRIVFTDNDHRHAKFTIRLKHDNLKQSDFFRGIITGYLNNDERICSYIDDIKPQSKTKKQKSKKLIQQGQDNLENFGFSERELSNLFDIIEEEHPEL